MERIKKVIETITDLDSQCMETAQKRLDNLTKPQGSLGRLEELAKIIVGITGKENPDFKNKVIFTLASDHGVAQEKVSAFPKEVTAQMVYNFLKGGAAINVLARHAGARVVVADVGVDHTFKIEGTSPRNFKDKKIGRGTNNFVKGPAMSKEEAMRSIEAGFEIFEEEYSRGIDIIGIGEMGIANTSAASAITAVFTKKPVEDLTGRGTGVDDKGLMNKIRVIKEALKVNDPDPSDPLGVLAKVGGFEIAGLAGIVLAGASKKIPVVIDGFISGAAALVAYHLQPRTKEYMIASHCSVEIGHKAILEHIGLEPVLDLKLRLGEGTGAALAISIVEASTKILTQMATFESAHVSERM